MPWKGAILAGTGHAPWLGSPEQPRPERALVQHFIDDLNDAVPDLGLTSCDIAAVMPGLLPAEKEGTAELAVRELIIDDTYLAEWEAEVTSGSEHDRGEGHEGGVGHGDEHGEDAGEEEQDAEEQVASQLKRIQEVRDEIASSGKDHLSDYWVETLEFKVLAE